MIKNLSKIDLLVVIGDIHAGCYSNSAEWFDNTKQLFYQFIFPFIKHVIKKYPDRNVKVLLTGDFFDIKQAVSTVIESESITIMEQLSELVEVLMMVGNHDCPSPHNTEINSVKPFYHINNVQVYPKTAILSTVTDEKILLMSYNSTKEKEKEIIDSNDAEYLFAHTEIAGFHYEGKPVEESKHNKIEDFAKFKRVYSAHIHKKQSKENILFLGTPRQVRANEFNNENGIYLIDFKEQKEYFIENKISPKFKVINVFTLMNMKLSEANEFVKNSYVTVVCPTNLMYKLNPHKIDQVLSEFKEIKHTNLSNKELGFDPAKPESMKFDGINGLDLESISIKNRFVSFIDQLSQVKIGKQFIEIDEAVKPALKDYIGKLYTSAETKIEDVEIKL